MFRDRDFVVALGVLWALSNLTSSAQTLKQALKKRLEPTTPAGTRNPETGDFREVPAARTPLELAALPELATTAITIVNSWEGAISDALRDWITLAPGAPSPASKYADAGKLLAAQMALETDGTRACYHYNVGNLHAARGDYFSLAGAPTERFTVYLYPLQGAVAMAARIKRKWPKAWYSLLSTPWSPSQYAQALRPDNGPQYYVGKPPHPVEDYAAGLKRWQRDLA